MPWPSGVEPVEVDRGPLRELFHLPVPQPVPGGLLDRAGRLSKRAPGALDGRQPPQPVRVLLGRQVQQRVSRVQVGVPPRTVGRAPHSDLAEHGRQPTLASRLRPLTRHPIGPDHPRGPRFPLRPQVQVILQQLPQQLPAVDLQSCLQLRVGQACRLLATQPGHHRLEAIT